MKKDTIPKFCKPCIDRLQSECPHMHTTMTGGWHLVNGDVWDDLVEICLDCGINLDELAMAKLMAFLERSGR